MHDGTNPPKRAIYIYDVLITAENDEERLHSLELYSAKGEWP